MTRAHGAALGMLVLAFALLGPSPVAEAGNLVLVDISAGEDHTCAVTDSGAVYCWGYNGYGQTGGPLSGPEICGGNGSSKYPCTTTPELVGSLQRPALRVSAEGDNSCAVLDDVTVACWGRNTYGQLGNGDATGPDTCTNFFGTFPCTSTAQEVEGADDANDVSVGGDHACIVRDGGTVKCWGDNTYGQLGTGDDEGPEECAGFPCSTTAVDVIGLSAPAESVSAGGGTTCAVLETGAVECWGLGALGRLGNGAMENSASPVEVTGLDSGVESVSVGTFHACALLDSGEVRCWGSNHGGYLGVGEATGPEKCGFQSYCATTPVTVGGLFSQGEPVQVESLSEINEETTCAILSDGDIKCWGMNNSGMLGVPHTGPETCGPGKCSRSPISMVEPPEGAVFVSNGGGHTCALTDIGGAWCWGTRFYGALGNGESGGGNVNDVIKYIPVQPIGMTGEPPGPKVLIGDVDCDGDIDSVDALKVLRHVASLSVSQTEPCPDVGTALGRLAAGPVETMGDVDCDGDVDSVDALKILRHVASLSVAQTEPCRDIGS